MRRASLNHVFRLIWSNAHSVLVSVTERNKRSGKSSSGTTPSVERPNRIASRLSASQLKHPKALSFSKLCLISTGLAIATHASAAGAMLPTDGSIVAGSGSISQTAGSMTIIQSTAKMAANWQTFNIGAGNSVNFVQPSAASSALNQVLGSDVSVIQGNLTANGQVFLVNPNGVLFTPTAQVNVGGLVASTLNLSTTDFMAGNFNFAGDSSNAIINQGSITAINGGNIALIAAKITNSGTLTANAGNVLLGAGAQVTLDLGGAVKLQVAQSAIDALIQNGGAIKADGGLVYLTAQAAGDLATKVISNTGSIEAQTLARDETGQIWLMGGMSNGNIVANNSIEVGGTLDASAPNGGNGGFIETSAANVKINDDVKVTTLATDGNSGTWLIDPTDFTIGAGSAAKIDSGMGATTLTNSLANTGVIIKTVGTGSELGDINVNSAVSWNSNELTLDAHNNININAVMTASGTSTLALISGAGVNAKIGTDTFTGRVDFAEADGSVARTGTNMLTINGAAYDVLNSVVQLEAMGVTGNFALGVNLGTAGTSFNFTPIGTFANNFDGLGHTITGMDIDGAVTANAGMFRIAGVASDIRNIGLVGGVVKNGAAGAGGLIGSGTGGNVSNSFNTGTVTGSAGVGGLVGAITTGSINNSYASGTITGTAGVGGLLGALSTGSIANSYSLSTVIGVAAVGGLIGNISTGSITRSYARGDVSASGVAGTAGGLVGTSNATITETYAAGTVTGDVRGGLMGTHTTGIVTNSYWDTDTSNLLASAGGVVPVAGTGKTTLEMKTESTFTGLDFTDTWYMANNAGYPILRALPEEPIIILTDLWVKFDTVTTRAYNGNPFTGGTLEYFSDATLNSVIIPVSNVLGGLTYTGTSEGKKDVGTYSITGNYATQTTPTYSITYIAGSLNITPVTVALSTTQTPATKVYDGLTTLANNAFTITTGIGSETLAYTGATISDAHVSTTNKYLNDITLANGTNGGLARNYILPALNSTTAPVTITSAPLTAAATITGVDKIYDGLLVATGSTIGGGFTGALNGDIIALNTSAMTLAFNNAHVANATTIASVGTATIGTFTGAGTGSRDGSAGNAVAGAATDYTITAHSTVAPVTKAITAKALTATATISGVDKVYDGLLLASGSTVTGTLSGQIHGDRVDLNTSGLTLAFNNAHVGSGTTIASTGTATMGTFTGGGVGTKNGTANNAVMGLSTDYVITSQTVADVTKAITVKGLAATATISGVDKIYDGLATATGSTISGTTSGTLNGDTVALDATSMTLAFSGANVASQIAISATGTAAIGSIIGSGVGSMDGTAGNQVAGLAGDYAITSQNTVASVTKAITPKALTATVTAASKTYDGGTTATNNILTITGGLISGETVTATGVATYNDKDVLDANQVTVDSTTLVSGAGGGLADNYSLVSGQTTNSTITTKALSATVAAPSKTYDGVNTAANNVLTINSGLIAQETITATGVATYNSKDVSAASNVTVNSTTLVDGAGGLASNYSLTSGQTVASTITAKALTATVATGSKTYDGNTNASNALTITAGLLNGENVNVTGVVAYNSKNVSGATEVTVSATTLSNGTNGLASNYSLATGQTAASTITTKALTATVAAVSRVYDGTDIAANTLTIDSSGLVNTETVTATGSATFNNKNVSTANLVTVNSTTLANGMNGGLASNYSLAGGATTGSTITAKALTATVAATSKIYDGNDTAANVLTITNGLVNGEQITATGVATFNSKNVGANTVTVNSTALQNGPQDGIASNYSLASGQNIASIITPKALTATVAAASKEYDGDTNAINNTVNITSGLVGQETLVSSGSATYNSKNVVAANTVTLNSVSLQNGTNGGLGINYSLVTGQQTAASTITAKALTATVDAVNRAYDGTDVAANTITIANSGFVGSETVTATGNATFNTKHVSTANLVTVNSTNLADGTNGGLASNYNLAAGATTNSNITAKALTATVVAASKIYDGNTSAANTLSIASGLVNNETIVATGIATFNTKDAGTKTVTVNSAALADGNNGGLASNYSLAAGTTAAGTITTKALTGTFTTASKTYDGNNIAVDTVSITGGLVANETVSIASGSATFNTKDVLTANLVTLNSTALADGTNGGLASNYSFATGQTASSTITAKALTATVVAASKEYDGNTNAANNVLTIATGLLGAETVTATGVAAYNSKDVSAATTVTVISTTLVDGTNNGLAANYSLAGGATTASTITAKDVTVTGMTANNKVFDNTVTATLSNGTVTGLVTGEGLTLTGQTATFADKEIATGIDVTVTGLTLADGPGTASNYNLTQQPTGLKANITVAPPVVVEPTGPLDNAIAQIQVLHVANTNFILPPQTVRAVPSSNNGAEAMYIFFKSGDQKNTSFTNARDSTNAGSQGIGAYIPGAIFVQGGGINYGKRELKN
jgi:filamentous hemagglutinin family protein